MQYYYFCFKPVCVDGAEPAKYPSLILLSIELAVLIPKLSQQSGLFTMPNGISCDLSGLCPQRLMPIKCADRLSGQLRCTGRGGGGVKALFLI